MKEMKKTVIITTLICLIPVIAGIILYPSLPDTIATHWGADGQPNGWQSKFVGAIVFPGSLALLNFFMPLILKMDPKYNNISDKVRSLVLWIIPVIACVCGGITLSGAYGKNLPVEIIIPALVGLLFVFIGNYLPKTGQSYTVGIKIPWTLNSEENWNRTHRLAGFLWVLCGLLVMISAFTPLRMPVMIVCMVLMTAVPIVYSYLYYKNTECKGKK